MRGLELALGPLDHQREGHRGCPVVAVTPLVNLVEECTDEQFQVAAAGLELCGELGHQVGTLIDVWVAEHPEPAPSNVVGIKCLTNRLLVTLEDVVRVVAPLFEDGKKVRLDEPLLEGSGDVGVAGPVDNSTPLGDYWTELGVVGSTVINCVDHCCFKT